jgi:hypothetical protein
MPSRLFLLSVVFFGSLVLAAGASDRSAPQAAPDGRTRLEVIEDLSESLANDMLDLSVAVRDRDWARIERFFGPTVTGTPLPCVPGSLVPRVKWISDRTWGTDPQASGATRTRDTLLGEWRRILDHYGEIEDVRFKVRGATFDDAAQAVSTANVPTALPGAAGHARIGFWIVGRNHEGRREWLRGSLEADVRYPEGGPWQVVASDKAQVGSMAASVDLFSEVSQPAGVSERIAAYGTRENSGFVWKGAAAGDVDGDGWIDLFVTGATRNFLYLNDGKGRFRDASDETGLKSLATGSGPLLADIDNDGDLDVFIAAVGPQVLLENRLVPDRKLRFEDVSLERGVAVTATGFSAAAADVNADGRVDFYVASYNAYGRVTPNSWSAATNGTPNLLFVSQPDGGFREEAAKWGVNDGRWSYAAVLADLTDDGRPDLYVANDFGEKGFFVHQGTSFKDEARERGVLDPGNGMGVAVGDYNNDGRLDLHVTNMSSTAGNRILGRMFPGAKPGEQVLVKLASGNALFENLGGGRFREVTAEVGGLSGMWAWGGGFLDFDNDGREDLFSPNGFISGKSMKDT